MTTGSSKREILRCSIEVYTRYMTIHDIQDHSQWAAYNSRSANSNPALSPETCLPIADSVPPIQYADSWTPSFLQTPASPNYHTLQRPFTHCGTSPSLLISEILDLGEIAQKQGEILKVTGEDLDPSNSLRKRALAGAGVVPVLLTKLMHRLGPAHCEHHL